MPKFVYNIDILIYFDNDSFKFWAASFKYVHNVLINIPISTYNLKSNEILITAREMKRFLSKKERDREVVKTCLQPAYRGCGSGSGCLIGSGSVFLSGQIRILPPPNQKKRILIKEIRRRRRLYI